ncbi:MAG: phage late control D family protein [Planctomycetes bacterium]|nr:phage late control D family protein [Planctomycetota bacterium]
MSIINPRRRLLIEGRDVAELITDDVLSVSVEDHVEDADACTFEFTNRRGEWLDHPLFERGNLVEVFLGYGTDLDKLFDGTITVVAPHFPEDGVPTVTITAYDKSYRMRKKGDVDEVFPDMTYNDIVRTVAKKYAFKESQIETSDETPKRGYVAQESEDDWHFLTNLADEIGFEVFVESGRLVFRSGKRKPSLISGTFRYRENLRSFEPELSVEKPPTKVIVRGWDDLRKEAFEVVVPDDLTAAERQILGDQSGAQVVGDEFGESKHILHDVVAEDRNHARDLALAYFLSKEYELVTATGACVGDPELRAKRLVNVAGVGERFSGTYYLTRVTHTLDDSGYLCEFEAKRNAISKVNVERVRDLAKVEAQGYQIEKR